MREGSKKKLLLVDYLTLSQCSGLMCCGCATQCICYLRELLPSNTSELTIGIIAQPTETVPSVYVNILCKLNISYVVIPYSDSLVNSVSKEIKNLQELKVMLLSTTHFLVDEAERSSWSVIKVPNQQGELAKSHLVGFKKKLDTRLLNHNRLTPFNLIISLDIDETLLFYEDSVTSGKILLNRSLLNFLKNIIESKEYPFLKIELLVVTARDRVEDKKAHKKNNPLSVECVMTEFQKAVQDFFSGKVIPVHYTQEKYEKLDELYGSRRNTLVVHFDDNPAWTAAFDESAHSHIQYVFVNSKKFPKFMFPADEEFLEKWCQPCASHRKRVSRSDFFSAVSDYGTVHSAQSTAVASYSPK